MNHQENDLQTETTCNACKQQIIGGNEITCHHCKAKYHLSPCGGVRETAYLTWNKTKKMEWRCTSCKMQTRTTPINNTEITTQTTTQKRVRENEEEKEEESGKTKQHRIGKDDSDIRNDVKEIVNMLKDMNKKNDELKAEMNNNFKTFNNTIANLLKQMQELEEQNKEKDTRIARLETKLNDMEQQTLQNNIEISNVPQQDNENINDTIQTISKAINIQIAATDITEIYRNRKSNIIIKLNSKEKKYERSCKTQRKKDNHNTAYNKTLLWLTKTAAKLNQWKYTWVRGGKIYTEKHEEANIITNREERDIKNIS